MYRCVDEFEYFQVGDVLVYYDGEEMEVQPNSYVINEHIRIIDGIIGWKWLVVAVLRKENYTV